MAEKGTALGIGSLVLVCMVFGRAAARVLLRAIAFWYAALHADVRRASAAYLSRVRGGAGFGAVYRHVLTFAEVTLDRIFLLRGRFRYFHAVKHGFEPLEALQSKGGGALLLLAHVGSMDALRALAEARDYPIHIVAFQQNARRIASVLRGMNAELASRVVEIDPRSPGTVLHMRELVDKGAMVAVMADRTDLSSRAVEAPFLGSPARFPTGPYLLAAMLHCPVYMLVGLYRPPNRYDLYCEPFAERVDLPRGRRGDGLEPLVRRYASRLEWYCREAPCNWFNFYDFWSMEHA